MIGDQARNRIRKDEVLRDLHELAQEGLSESVLLKCKALADHVHLLDKHELLDDYPRHRALSALLEAVASKVRETTTSAYSQKLAAAEFIGIRDEELDDPPLKGYENRTALVIRRKRGGRHLPPEKGASPETDRNIRKRVPEALRAFLVAIEDFLASRQDMDRFVASLEAAEAKTSATSPSDVTTAALSEAVSDRQPPGSSEQQPHQRDAAAALAPSQSAVQEVAPVRGPRPPDHPAMKEAFHRLAASVKSELRHQRGRTTREANILVRWQTEQAGLFDKWAKIRSDRQDKPLSLDNDFAHIKEVFESIPSHRLVVLGQGGAGKTVLLTELALQILSSEQAGYVPVILPLTSWNPQQQDLRDWMIAQIVDRDRRLSAATGQDGTLATDLVDGDHVLPLLDGFDEIQPELRDAAIRKINDWLHEDRMLVLASRPDEYKGAVDKSEALSRAAGVTLEPLGIADIRNHLCVNACQPEKWNGAISRMEAADDDNGRRVREALSTPLMTFLAQTVYDEANAIPDELLDESLYPTVASIQDYLLNQFVPTVYRLPARRDGPDYEVDKARRWLGLLAAHLVSEDTTEFAWWKASGVLLDGPLRDLFLFLFPVGGSVFVTALIMDVATHGQGGVVLAALNYVGAFSMALLFAAGYVGTQGQRLTNQRLHGRAGAVMLRNSMTPRATLRLERLLALIAGGVFGIAPTVLCLVLWIVGGNAALLQWIPLAIFAGCAAVILVVPGSIGWFVRCSLLAMCGQLPWRFMRFLGDAHDRGVLRQYGGTYQFRHVLLQDSLAGQYIDRLLRPKRPVSGLGRLRYKLKIARIRHGDTELMVERLRAISRAYEGDEAWDAALDARLALADALVEKGDFGGAWRNFQLLRLSEVSNMARGEYRVELALARFLIMTRRPRWARWVYDALKAQLLKDVRSFDYNSSSRARQFHDELRNDPISFEDEHGGK